MNHAHDYHIVADLVLSLPDHTGLYDRLLQFQCACGQYTVVHHGKELGAAPETCACPRESIYPEDVLRRLHSLDDLAHDDPQ